MQKIKFKFRITNGGYIEFDYFGIDISSSESDKSIMTCFHQLGLDQKTATIDMVKQKYRELAKKYHPDYGGSEQLFKALTEAKNQCLQYLGQSK